MSRIWPVRSLQKVLSLHKNNMYLEARNEDSPEKLTTAFSSYEECSEIEDGMYDSAFSSLLHSDVIFTSVALSFFFAFIGNITLINPSVN